MFSEASRKTGRQMVLSFHPGRPPSANAPRSISIHSRGHLRRCLGCLVQRQEFSAGVKNQSEKAALWAGAARPGRPDADMLPLGVCDRRPVGASHETRLTHDEQRTLITLWSMFRSPLIWAAICSGRMPDHRSPYQRRSDRHRSAPKENRPAITTEIWWFDSASRVRAGLLRGNLQHQRFTSECALRF